MRSSNPRQIGIVMLLIGSLIIAMVAGYLIALLATRMRAQALPPAPAPEVSAAAAVQPSVMAAAPTPDPTPDSQAVVAPPAAEGAQTATDEPDVTLPEVAPPAATDTAGEELLADQFDSAASGWLERTTPEWSATYADGQYRLALTGQPTIGVSAPLPAESYRLTVDVTVTEGAGGLIFLAGQPDIFYRFMLDLNGMYAIQVQHQDQSDVTYAVDWTYSDILQRPAGSTYRVRVERQADLVRFWVNDEPLTAWAVPENATSNQFGFAVSSPEGRATAAFDNLAGERLAGPSGE